MEGESGSSYYWDRNKQEYIRYPRYFIEGTTVDVELKSGEKYSGEPYEIIEQIKEKTGLSTLDVVFTEEEPQTPDHLWKSGTYKCTIDFAGVKADYSFSVIEPASDGLPGDVNMDGKVNNKDVTRLMKYIKYKNVEVDMKAIDVNGDGKSNNKDVTRLMKYIKYGNVNIFYDGKEYKGPKVA